LEIMCKLLQSQQCYDPGRLFPSLDRSNRRLPKYLADYHVGHMNILSREGCAPSIAKHFKPQTGNFSEKLGSLHRMVENLCLK